MPELPDVEQHRRRFDDDAAGRTVTGVAVPDRDILAGTSPQGLGRSLGGRTLDGAARHGKWLILPTAGGGPRLLVHFRMTGELVVSDDPADRTDRDAVILRLDGREVRYRTVRRMGVVHWLPAGRSTETVTGPLGVDALALGPGDLADVLHGRRGGVKSALMDQELIAGLGNELVDEILWRARLHPRSRVRGLGADDLDGLDTSLRRTLRRAVRAGHVPAGPTWLNRQRGRDDPRCPDCGSALERTRVAGRATYVCPLHQPAPDR